MGRKVNTTIGVDDTLLTMLDVIIQQTRRQKASLIREGIELVISKYRRNPHALPQEGIDDDILSAGSFGLATEPPRFQGPIPVPAQGPVSMPGVPSQPMGPPTIPFQPSPTAPPSWPGTPAPHTHVPSVQGPHGVQSPYMGPSSGPPSAGPG